MASQEPVGHDHPQSGWLWYSSTAPHRLVKRQDGGDFSDEDGALQWPLGTQVLICAVDVERSGPHPSRHSTIAVGVAIVAWGQHPRTHCAFQKLLWRVSWPCMSPTSTVFSEAAWSGMWGRRLQHLARFVVPLGAVSAASPQDPRRVLRRVLFSVREKAAGTPGVKCHLVSDNPAYDFPAVDAWLATHPESNGGDVRRRSHVPLGGGLSCWVEHTAAIPHRAWLPINYDQAGRWSRMRCLRSVQEGLLGAAEGGSVPGSPAHAGAHTVTGHTRRMHDAYALPHDCSSLRRYSHMPDHDAHAVAHDYAHTLAIRAKAVLPATLNKQVRDERVDSPRKGCGPIQCKGEGAACPEKRDKHVGGAR